MAIRKFKTAIEKFDDRMAKLKLKTKTTKGQDLLGIHPKDTNGNTISLDKLHERLHELNKLACSTKISKERKKAREELQKLMEANPTLLI